MTEEKAVLMVAQELSKRGKASENQVALVRRLNSNMLHVVVLDITIEEYSKAKLFEFQIVEGEMFEITKT